MTTDRFPSICIYSCKIEMGENKLTAKSGFPNLDNKLISLSIKEYSGSMFTAVNVTLMDYQLSICQFLDKV